jgi:hypothetical protein
MSSKNVRRISKIPTGKNTDANKYIQALLDLGGFQLTRKPSELTVVGDF